MLLVLLLSGFKHIVWQSVLWLLDSVETFLDLLLSQIVINTFCRHCFPHCILIEDLLLVVEMYVSGLSDMFDWTK